MLSLLHTALDMEHEGIEFYESAIKKCGNRLGVEIFGALLADEILHVERIKTIYSALQNSGEWDKGWETFKSRDTDAKLFFMGLAEKNRNIIGTGTGDIEAVDIGLELEKKAVAYYQSALGRATSPDERLFLEKMVAEEKKHYALLQDTKSFLIGPKEWFLKQKTDR